MCFPPLLALMPRGGRMMALKRLLLDHNALSGTVPSTMSCLSKLRWIDITHNRNMPGAREGRRAGGQMRCSTPLGSWS